MESPSIPPYWAGYKNYIKNKLKKHAFFLWGCGGKFLLFKVVVCLLTPRNERSQSFSIRVISKFPMMILHPVYLSLISFYWFSWVPVELRPFWVPEHTTSKGWNQREQDKSYIPPTKNSFLGVQFNQSAAMMIRMKVFVSGKCFCVYFYLFVAVGILY